MSHNLRHDDAVMAVGGAVQAINGVGGDAQGCGITKRGIGHGHIVVDGLGQRDDVNASLV